MTETFEVMAASADIFEDLNAFIVCLAEEEDGSGRRLEIQQALSFDEQDRRNGMDTYCLSNESGASHYGGVQSWALTNGVLRVDLDVSASNSLGVAGYEVVLRVPPPEIQKVMEGLHRILGGPSR
ncbi:MAG: hypothetical protein HUU21_22210 [Polyangiaceae bacterium]|nr:hypothetical protein [Polyangiaceae bacterium]